MFLPKKDRIEKRYSDDIIVWEYSQDYKDLPIDGAISYINDKFANKICHFTELFFCLGGELDIIIDSGETFTLKAEDIYIMPQGVKHSLVGREARVFIVCNPPFDAEKMEMCEGVDDETV